MRGIADRGVLGSCDAILSGYLGTEEQGEHVAAAVGAIKAANARALYVCDPVMGHLEKGCVVPEGVQRYHAERSIALADVLCPNVLELGVMARGAPPTSPREVVEAARSLIARGPRLVLVKHLAHAGARPDESFEMALIDATSAWHVACPLLPFSRPPVGVGDLTSAVFVARLLLGDAPPDALEHTAGAYHAVMAATSAVDEYELQLVAAQDGICQPPERFNAQPLENVSRHKVYG